MTDDEFDERYVALKADLLRAIADGKQMQGRLPEDGGGWFDIYPDQAIGAIAGGYATDVRIKPETVLINGIECPAPMRVAPAAQPQEELREDASYESMNLAVMVLSDCGHSSNYTPLLERVAGRIDRHVERLLTAQRADLTRRAQAEPAAPASQDAEDAARYRYLKKYKTWDSTDVFYWLRCAPADEVDSIIDAAMNKGGAA